MKQTLRLKGLLMSLMLMLSASVSAEDFVVDGVAYTINDDKSVFVDYKYGGYSGAIKIPETVTYEGKTYNVTQIFGWAFRDTELTSVVVPASVTYIGEYAFAECEKLDSVTILGTPETTVNGMSNEIFYETSNISYFAYKGNFCIGSSQLKEVILLEGTKRVTDYALYGSSGLTSITIPDGVEEIGEYAFCGCSGLTSIVIPKGVTWIGNSAFCNCKGLISIELPDGVISMGEYVFDACSNLTSISIPESVTYIDERAFRNCTSLTSITLPKGIKRIYNGLFEGCTNLSSVNIPENVSSIYQNAFKNCSSLTTMEIPENVDYIEGGAFYGCTGLTAFILDEDNQNYTTLNGVLFNKEITEIIAIPGGLTSVPIPETMTVIGDYAFSGCFSLTSLDIPESITSIGKYAFDDCSALTSISIPESVTAIKECTFRGCSSLTSINIPQTVTSIGYSAFSGCSSLTSIVIPESITVIEKNTFEDCSALLSIELSDSITEIGERAFEDCSALTSIYIPQGVTTIKGYTFYDCSSLTSIVIPDNVTSIGEWAFNGCSALDSIVIPETITSIARGAFAGCSALESIVIPESVKSIEGSVFRGCSGLTAVKLHNGITTIGSSAFSNCTGLTSFYIPDSVETIVGYAFENCANLKSIHIPESVTSIGSSAFKNCSSLKSVVIPENVTALQRATFEGCELLDSVTIKGTPDTPYGSGWLGLAFEGCSSLSYFAYKGNFEISSVMTNCRQLKEVILLEGTTQIVDYALYGCKGITSVVIPQSVENIGSYAFGNCTSLTDIYSCLYTPLEIKSSVFYDIEKDSCTLHVPHGSRDAYATADVWKKFINIQERYYTEVALDFVAEDMLVGETLQLTATITPTYAVGNGAQWLTSDSKVATVDDNGQVTAVGAGTATITAVANDGSGASAQCELVVSAVPAESMALDKTEISLKKGESVTLIATVSPENTTDKSVVWSSSDENVVVVDTDGVVTAVGSGYAKIYATSNDNTDIQVYCDVTVAYQVVYIIDGEEYKVIDVFDGDSVTAEEEPTKEGHTFSGWSEIPEIMPAEDVEIIGSFTANIYKVTYIVDGVKYKTVEVAFGEVIPNEEAPTKEGCEFSGWSYYPDKMPAKDITVIGAFSTPDGIIGVSADTQVDVYNLHGLKVASKIAVEDLKTGLEDGIYIINGRQYLIK